MDKIDNSFLGMSDRVMLVFDQHPTVNNGISVIITIIDDIRGLNTIGKTLLKEKEEQEASGFTDAKNQKFAEMIKAAFVLGKKITSFAQVNKLYELLPLVNFSDSGIKKGSEKEVESRCKTIVSKAYQYIDQLADYQITRPEVDSLNTIIGEFEVMPNLRDSVKNTKKITGNDLRTTIQTIREKYEILDNMVEGMITDKTFVQLYFEARIVVEHGNRKNQTTLDTAQTTPTTKA